jgi:hypothetical protein
MIFGFFSHGFALCSSTGPYGQQPFCRLALLRFGHGARTAPSSRRASQQNDLPLGAPGFSTVS